MGWLWLAVIALALLLLALLATGLLLLRARALARVVGSFECAWRPVGHPEWTSGVACYGVGRLDWYRLVSLAPRPSRRWDRVMLDVTEFHPLPGAARSTIEARCRLDDEEFFLALNHDALAGLTGWLESLPPTTHGVA